MSGFSFLFNTSQFNTAGGSSTALLGFLFFSGEYQSTDDLLVGYSVDLETSENISSETLNSDLQSNQHIITDFFSDELVETGLSAFHLLDVTYESGEDLFYSLSLQYLLDVNLWSDEYVLIDVQSNKTFECIGESGEAQETDLKDESIIVIDDVNNGEYNETELELPPKLSIELEIELYTGELLEPITLIVSRNQSGCGNGFNSIFNTSQFNGVSCSYKQPFILLDVIFESSEYNETELTVESIIVIDDVNNGEYNETELELPPKLSIELEIELYTGELLEPITLIVSRNQSGCGNGFNSIFNTSQFNGVSCSAPASDLSKVPINFYSDQYSSASLALTRHFISPVYTDQYVGSTLLNEIKLNVLSYVGEFVVVPVVPVVQFIVSLFSDEYNVISLDVEKLFFVFEYTGEQIDSECSITTHFELYFYCNETLNYNLTNYPLFTFSFDSSENIRSDISVFVFFYPYVYVDQNVSSYLENDIRLSTNIYTQEEITPYLENDIRLETIQYSGVYVKTDYLEEHDLIYVVFEFDIYDGVDCLIDLENDIRISFDYFNGEDTTETIQASVLIDLYSFTGNISSFVIDTLILISPNYHSGEHSSSVLKTEQLIFIDFFVGENTNSSCENDIRFNVIHYSDEYIINSLSASILIVSFVYSGNNVNSYLDSDDFPPVVFNSDECLIFELLIEPYLILDSIDFISGEEHSSDIIVPQPIIFDVLNFGVGENIQCVVQIQHEEQFEFSCFTGEFSRIIFAQKSSDGWPSVSYSTLYDSRYIVSIEIRRGDKIWKAVNKFDIIKLPDISIEITLKEKEEHEPRFELSLKQILKIGRKN